MVCSPKKIAGIRLNYFIFLAIFLPFLITGCDTSGDSDYPGDFNRDFATGIKPEIIGATLLDENGNEVYSEVIDGNRVIMPSQRQKIGFEIVFRTLKDVTAEVILSQYTPMDLLYQEEPVYCYEEFGCPDPEKGEISYYGEEIFSGTPYVGPQRYDVPPEPVNEEEVDGEETGYENYDFEEEGNYLKHYFRVPFYYTVDFLGYERMFRFQVQDSAGYISRHLVIYTKVPL
jgi:hypothetical protein